MALILRGQNEQTLILTFDEKELNDLEERKKEKGLTWVEVIRRGLNTCR